MSLYSYCYYKLIYFCKNKKIVDRINKFLYNDCCILQNLNLIHRKHTMKEFFITNSLGIFSLIILIFLIIQDKNFYDIKEARINKMRFACLICAFATQSIDILAWGLSGVVGENIRIFSYFVNCLYFIFSVSFCFIMACFLEYNINYSKESHNFLKRIFTLLFIINLIFTVLSIPFSWYFYLDQSNNYIRGPLNFVSTGFAFFALFFVYLRVIFIYREESKNFKGIFTIGLLIPLIADILQVTDISPIPILIPSVTLSILFFYFFLINSSLYTDYLTGLQNIRGINKFFDDLPNVISNYLAVIFIDLNDFKSVNDEYGHKEGDLIISNFSNIISRIVKKNDLAARIGGDEFLIASIINNKDELDLIIKKIESEVNIYNKNSNKPYKLSISCGTSLVEPNVFIDKEKIINQADRRMYDKKNKG